MRDSVVFYRSFYEAVKDLPPEDFKKSVSAILDYGLDGVVPDTVGIEKTLYIMAKPQIDANNRRYTNGLKGWRTKAEPKQNQNKTKTEPKRNQSETKVKPKQNQTETKAEPNVNVKVNVNDNVNDNDKEISAPVDSCESPCAGKFLLNDGSEYVITENDVEVFQQLYPGIDVRQEIRGIEGWCLSNPKNRKTRSGAKRFMNAWFSRAQNSARPVDKKQAEKKKNNSFTNYSQRTYDQAALERMLIGGDNP